LVARFFLPLGFRPASLPSTRAPYCSSLRPSPGRTIHMFCNRTRTVSRIGYPRHRFQVACGFAMIWRKRGERHASHRFNARSVRFCSVAYCMVSSSDRCSSDRPTDTFSTGQTCAGEKVVRHGIVSLSLASESPVCQPQTDSPAAVFCLPEICPRTPLVPSLKVRPAFPLAPSAKTVTT
jgi:hypothetical protein